MHQLEPKQGYPAHGPILEDAKTKIMEYINHRKQREGQILEVLNSNGGSAKGSMEIVKIIYLDVPETLHNAAERGVLQVLRKLEKENTVAKDEDKWKLVKTEKTESVL